MKDQRGNITHTIGGVERTFRATLQSLDRAESATGQTVQNWMMNGLTVAGAVALLRTTCTPELSAQEVQELVDELGVSRSLALATQILQLGVLGREELDLLFPDETEKKNPAMMKEDGHGGE